MWNQLVPDCLSVPKTTPLVFYHWSLCSFNAAQTRELPPLNRHLHPPSTSYKILAHVTGWVWWHMLCPRLVTPPSPLLPPYSRRFVLICASGKLLGQWIGYKLLICSEVLTQHYYSTINQRARVYACMHKPLHDLSPVLIVNSDWRWLFKSHVEMSRFFFLCLLPLLLAPWH